jgi:chromosome segregation ATPase
MGELIQQPAEISLVVALISLLVAIVLLRKRLNRHRTEVADKTQKLREFKKLFEENAASLSALTADFDKAQAEIKDKAVDLERVRAEVEDKAKQLNELKPAAKERDQLKAKYSGIIDVQQRLSELITQLDGVAKQTEETQARYKKKRQWLSKLESELALYEDRFAWAKLGMYEPHFDFDHSDEYKVEIKDIRQRQKDMIRSEIAVQHLIEWTVNNSQVQGRQMMKRAERLTLRSFNNECEAAINRVKWNNVNAMEERIRKAFKSINRYNASNKLIIDEQ